MPEQEVTKNSIEKYLHLAAQGIYEFNLPLDSRNFELFLEKEEYRNARSIAIRSPQQLTLDWLHKSQSLSELRLHTDLKGFIEIGKFPKLELVELSAASMSKVRWSTERNITDGVILHSPDGESLARLGGRCRNLLVSGPPEVWPEIVDSDTLRRLVISRVHSVEVNLTNIAASSRLEALIFSGVTKRIENSKNIAKLLRLREVRFGNVKRDMIDHDWLFELPKLTRGFYELSPGFFTAKEYQKLVDAQIAADS